MFALESQHKERSIQPGSTDTYSAVQIKVGVVVVGVVKGARDVCVNVVAGETGENGCPALLDAELKRLVVFSYTCLKNDGAEIGEGPKVALEKLLSKLSASVVLDMEFE